MTAETFADGVFAVNSDVRYVAVLGADYVVLFSKMRPGVPSITPDATDREFVSVVPANVLDSVKQLLPYCGPLKTVTVRYEKIVLAFYQTYRHVIVLSLEPSIETSYLDKIGNEIAKLEAMI